MIRVLAFLLLASHAVANPYDDLILAQIAIAPGSDTDGSGFGFGVYLPFSTTAEYNNIVTSDHCNGTTVAQSSVSGTTTYGIPMGVNVTGFASSSSVTVATGVLAANPHCIQGEEAYSLIFWLSSTDTGIYSGYYGNYGGGDFLTNSAVSTSLCEGGFATYLISRGTFFTNPTCTSSVLDGNSHMVANVCPHSGYCAVYVDGVLQGNSTTPGPGLGSVAGVPFYVGNVGNTTRVNAAIGAFAIIQNILLTPDQIRVLYHCGKFGTDCGRAPSSPIGQIIGLRDTTSRLPAALRGAYRRIEPASVSFERIGDAQRQFFNRRKGQP